MTAMPFILGTICDVSSSLMIDVQVLFTRTVSYYNALSLENAIPSCKDYPFILSFNVQPTFLL
jgi:hypothetical protein